MDNWQSIAYASLAMKNRGFTDEQIRTVTREMSALFDELTEEEVEARWDEVRFQD